MNVCDYAWLIVLAPLAGFVINGFFGKYFSEKTIGLIGSFSVLISFALSFVIFLKFTGSTPHPSFEIEIFTWISIGVIHVPAAYLFDTLSLVMILVVTGVGTLIHFYSTGYMKGESGFARYFAYLNLFIFFMLTLVLGNNLILMFLGWEGVGLCSYLLIGFYYETDHAPAAGMKAFVVNRIGDMGFLIGIFLVITNFGTLHFGELAVKTAAVPVNVSLMTFTTMMFFAGATGKSAQIPLYVWLPDAMAGPTPVSALIHAATMVTAGVYMIARLNFIFVLAPVTMATVAVAGGVTALFAATIGIMQMDIKKVLAYSTISQLGYMFMAMGVGAFSAGIFHLVTHAFFKALLFLGSGSVIYALHHEQDMRNMGGLYKKLPVTFITFLMGTLAIAGTPLFSGFFSKDEILWKVYNYNFYLWCAGALAAVITSFYMFRLVFLTFSGETRYHEHGGHAVHESPKIMTIPLVILAVLSVISGLLALPHLLDVFHSGNIFEHFLSRSVEDAHRTVFSDAVEWRMMGVSVAAALTGFITALIIYWKKRYVPDDDSTITGLRKIIYKKYYVDELYQHTIITGTISFSKAVYRYFDVLIIDGIVNGTGRIILRTGERMRSMQTGVVHDYMFSMIIGVTLLLMYVLADKFF